MILLLLALAVLLLLELLLHGVALFLQGFRLALLLVDLALLYLAHPLLLGLLDLAVAILHLLLLLLDAGRRVGLRGLLLEVSTPLFVLLDLGLLGLLLTVAGVARAGFVRLLCRRRGGHLVRRGGSGWNAGHWVTNDTAGGLDDRRLPRWCRLGGDALAGGAPWAGDMGGDTSLGRGGKYGINLWCEDGQHPLFEEILAIDRCGPAICALAALELVPGDGILHPAIDPVVIGSGAVN